LDFGFRISGFGFRVHRREEKTGSRELADNGSNGSVHLFGGFELRGEGLGDSV
jgi:hypothetical protein